MPALTRSLWAGFPTSRWHCLAVLSGRLPPPFTLFFFLFFLFGKHTAKTPETFILLFMCCTSPAPISAPRHTWKRLFWISHACTTTGRSLVCFYGGPWAAWYLPAPFYAPHSGIYHLPPKHKRQQWLLPALQSGAIHAQAAGLEQFVQVTHYSFLLSTNVQNQTPSREMAWRTNMRSFPASFPIVQILKLSIISAEAKFKSSSGSKKPSEYFFS